MIFVYCHLMNFNNCVIFIKTNETIDLRSTEPSWQILTEGAVCKRVSQCVVFLNIKNIMLKLLKVSFFCIYSTIQLQQ